MITDLSRCTDLSQKTGKTPAMTSTITMHQSLTSFPTSKGSTRNGARNLRCSSVPAMNTIRLCSRCGTSQFTFPVKDPAQNARPPQLWGSTKYMSTMDQEAKLRSHPVRNVLIRYLHICVTPKWGQENQNEPYLYDREDSPINQRRR